MLEEIWKKFLGQRYYRYFSPSYGINAYGYSMQDIKRLVAHKKVPATGALDKVRKPKVLFCKGLFSPDHKLEFTVNDMRITVNATMFAEVKDAVDNPEHYKKAGFIGIWSGDSWLNYLPENIVHGLRECNLEQYTEQVRQWMLEREKKMIKWGRESTLEREIRPDEN